MEGFRGYCDARKTHLTEENGFGSLRGGPLTRVVFQDLIRF